MAGSVEHGESKPSAFEYIGGTEGCRYGASRFAATPAAAPRSRGSGTQGHWSSPRQAPRRGLRPFHWGVAVGSSSDVHFLSPSSGYTLRRICQAPDR